ncbi:MULTISPECIES: OmpA family protein [unclassified Polaromonas]|uniref:OmpA family protein n=1 Tax=unclassified Polaromonas TaxID=2638319 RepID=UPI000F0898C6|nr:MULTISPECIES: OmpA family protein [unclassified Polaromonas]AYQ28799.1 OmpA family protein [Polaromonas sp. SP1]QGJ20086.1 OmpA family protein [Polaromonas sp. Pch-P]
MFSQDDEGQQGLVLAVVLGLIAFVVTLVIGISLHRLHRGQPPAPPAPLATATGTAVAAPAPAPAPIDSAPLPAAAEPPANLLSTRQAATDAATVTVEQGVVRFYFASGKADLAAGAGDALGDVVKAAKAGRTLVISGFHDATGDAAKNAALAKQRAVAVKDALKAAGVPERQIELKKPEQLAAGAGSDAEARRVEITLQ